MPELPSGTVTFLFTDIEDRTRLRVHDRKAMAAAVERDIAMLMRPWDHVVTNLAYPFAAIGAD